MEKEFAVDESYGKISGDLFKGYIYDFNKAIELYQPKEIEVEIVMKPYTEVSEGWTLEKKEEPKLDSSGCLIIKKK